MAQVELTDDGGNVLAIVPSDAFTRAANALLSFDDSQIPIERRLSPQEREEYAALFKQIGSTGGRVTFRDEQPLT